MASSYNVAVLTEMIAEATAKRGDQTRLAEAVGVEVQTVNKWVKGQTHPDPARWAAIEEHLGWPEGEIALRVMPALGTSTTHQLVVTLTEQVQALADRVADLERRALGRTARSGSRGTPPPPPV